MNEPRDILVFLDGTNNTLTGRRTDTNVLHLFEHVSARQDPRQLVYYDPGVGSPDLLPFTDLNEWLSRKSERLRGLASGRGIFENVGQAYTFIAKNHQPGDRIWIFGFSRGAFTARSVAGMIHLFGLIRPEHESILPTLLRVYFAEPEPPPPHEEQTDSLLSKQKHRSEVAEQVRASFTSPAGHDATVHFVGVWDTVATVGLWPFNLRISSKATIKGKRIRHVRHALALDEHRAVFEPRLYSDDNFTEDGQSLLQLWFRGVHCDVGGGYLPRTSGLATEALLWMAEEARACGLACDPPLLGTIVEGLAKPGRVERMVHDPLKELGLWSLVGMQVRDTTRALGTDGDEAPIKPFGYEGDATPAPSSVWKKNAWDVAGAGAVALAAGAAALTPWVRRLFLADLQLAGLQIKALYEPVRSLGSLAEVENVGLVVGFDLAFIVVYSLFFALLLPRAFARAAGLRRAGDGRSLLSWLGLALPVLVVGDLAEDALGLLAAKIASGPTATVVLWLGGLGSAMKLIGLAACLSLLAWGFLFTKRAGAAAPAAPQQPVPLAR